MTYGKEMRLNAHKKAIKAIMIKTYHDKKIKREIYLDQKSIVF